MDIVLDNAGYSLVGTTEKGSPDEIRALYETDVLGPVSVIQAVLPLLGEQGYGHIVGTSVGELAYALGFEYPQSFSKLFKSKTQLSH